MTSTERRIAAALWLITIALCLVRYFHLTADFPNHSPWQMDQAKFTDEGFWASAAINHHLTGRWLTPGDYNPAAALPVWPVLLGLLFHFTGVSITATRALNVTLSIATLAAVYALLRRYKATPTNATLAILLLAASPFSYAFSRLATLETLVIFEFALLLLTASCVSTRRLWPWVVLPILITATILTKTTAIALLPAVYWLVASRLNWNPNAILRAAIGIVILPALLIKEHATLIAALGFGNDYHYFFDENGMPDIVWNQSIHTFLTMLRNSLWIDRILAPLLAAILIAALTRKRSLWRNPLFTASWIALAGQMTFLFSRQDDFAPRYFLVMLLPTVLIVATTFNDLTMQPAKALLLTCVAASITLNIAAIASFIHHRDDSLFTAAQRIQEIVNHDPTQPKLILGISSEELSLFTGIPPLSDTFGTADLDTKIARYHPGWYLGWTGLPREYSSAFAPFRVEEVARFHVFDDPERDTLILYKLAPRSR